MARFARTLVAIFMLALVVPYSIAGAQGRVVDEAKAAVRPGCNDGIGYSYTTHQEQDAEANNDLSAFIDLHAACDPTSFNGPALVAQCTDPTRLPQMIAATTWVVCLLHVVNPAEGEAVTVSIGDFILASNDVQFSPDAVASAADSPLFDLTRQPKQIAAGDHAEGMVVFQVPNEVGQEDLLLAWQSAQLKPLGVTGEGIRLIIVQDRDPSIVRLLQTQGGTPESGQPQQAQTATPQDTFNGDSDDVTSPISLGARLHVIEASYQGDGNFSVIAHWGDQQKLLVNKIGAYSGRVALTLDAPASVIFEVQASGPWTIRVEGAP